MQDEIFVINSIKNSEKAFSAAIELIPVSNRNELLKVLRNERQLFHYANKLNLSEEEVFEYLARAIEAFIKRERPLRFTRDDFYLLRDSDVKKLLSEVLNTSVDEVNQKLFVVERLHESLEDINERLGADSSPATQIWDVDVLIDQICEPSRAKELEIQYTTTENDWEPVLNYEGWLSEAAKQLLVDQKSGTTSDSPVKGLVRLIETVKEERKLEKPHNDVKREHIGPLGLIAIRRRIHWMSSLLNDQIEKNINRSHSDSPDHSIFRLIKSSIDFYGLGSLRKAVDEYVDQHKPLCEMLESATCEKGNCEEKYAIPNEKFYVSIENKPFYLAKKSVNNVTVMCKVSNNTDMQVLSRYREVPTWLCEVLAEKINTMSPENIVSDPGDSLHEKMLNHRFSIVSPDIERLLALLMLLEKCPKINAEKKQDAEEQDAEEQPEDKISLFRKLINNLNLNEDYFKWKLPVEYIQALSLSCQKPFDIPEYVWPEYFKLRAPYEDIPSVDDPYYETGTEQIIGKLQEKYPHATIENGC